MGWRLLMHCHWFIYDFFSLLVGIYSNVEWGLFGARLESVIHSIPMPYERCLITIGELIGCCCRSSSRFFSVLVWGGEGTETTMIEDWVSKLRLDLPTSIHASVLYATSTSKWSEDFWETILV